MLLRRPKPSRDVHGIVLLDKPGGITSNQALQRVKRLYQAAKAGHTGSLDPLATGMLPVCLGSATKVSAYLLDADKRYTVSCSLGVATDSGDADGQVIAKTDGSPSLDAVAVRQVLSRFVGDIEQVPPMYSALKVGGQRLYELARRGLDIPRTPRTVRISAIELVSFTWPQLEFRVTCAKGTYVRTLVEDVAKAMGTLGHVTALRRTAVAPFEEPQMLSLRTIEQRALEGTESADRLLLPPDGALVHWPRFVLQADLCASLSNGQSVPAEPEWPRTWVRLYSPAEQFFGIGEVRGDGQLVPRRIFPALTSWR